MRDDGFASFVATHVAALRADEVRHNIMLAVLQDAATDPSRLRWWALDRPGQCAIQSAGRPLLLGALDEVGCAAIAALTRAVPYSGVVGPQPQLGFFVQAASALGIGLEPYKSMRLHTLTSRSRLPGAVGEAREAVPDDEPLIHAWLSAFREEATPHDPSQTREGTQRYIARGHFLLWLENGAPVSMAARTRTLARSASINAVYTLPHKRSRGYAGSAVGSVAAAIFASGKDTALLYTDLSNLASNRCYAKIGFRPHSDFGHYLRTQ